MKKQRNVRVCYSGAECLGKRRKGVSHTNYLRGVLGRSAEDEISNGDIKEREREGKRGSLFELVAQSILRQFGHMQKIDDVQKKCERD